MSTEHILVERQSDGLAVVTLNRPDKRNAITLAMWRGLAAHFSELGSDNDVRAVVLAGSGEHFSAGGDISEFAIVRADTTIGKKYEDAEEEALLAIFNCPKPVIAQISGFAIGGACALALTCDFRVAHTGATFFIPAGRLGIVYSRVETEMVLRQVGLTNAKRILFAGERIGAEDATRLGIVTDLTDGNVQAAARALAHRFLASAPLSIAGSKFILNALARGEADARAEEIDRFIRLSMESEDYKEGQLAFREKRQPRFRGR